MNRKIKKFISIMIGATLMAGVLTGCGNSATKSNVSAENSKKVIKVGTINCWKPYCYVDEDGNLSGFDIDVINAVAEKLPQYEINVESSDFEAIFTSLGAGKFDLVTCEFMYTDERAEKYLYSDVSYNTDGDYLVVSADSDITSIDQLQDVTVWGGSTNCAEYLYWTSYIAEHPEQNIKVESSSQSSQDEAIVQAISNGTYAAILDTRALVKTVNDTYGDVYKIVGDSVNETPRYHVFNKDNKAFRDEWDAALKEVLDEGTIDELKVKWFGDVK